MDCYIWTFNGKPIEIKLKRITRNFYIFEYPANSTEAGKDWRMSKDTFSKYQANGVIRKAS